MYHAGGVIYVEPAESNKKDPPHPANKTQPSHAPYLLHEQHAPRIDKFSSIDTVKIQTAWQTRCIELQLVPARRVTVIGKNGNLLAQHVVYLDCQVCIFRKPKCDSCGRIERIGIVLGKVIRLRDLRLTRHTNGRCSNT